MEDQIEWLKAHRFELDKDTGEWTRNIDVMSFFKIDQKDGEKPKFDKRKTMNLRIVAAYVESESMKGWAVKVLSKRGYNLDNNNGDDENITVVARNDKSYVADTVIDSLGLACDNLCKSLILCLKQAADLSTKELRISFEEPGGGN